MSLQQVNLLTPDLVPAKNWLSVQSMAIVTGVFVVGLLSFSGMQSIKAAKLEQVRSESELKLSELNAVRGTEPPTQSSVRAELDQLQQARLEQEKLLRRLVAQEQYDRFSPFLLGLASARVDGLWLYEIDIRMLQGQLLIGLKGRAVHADRLPELLQHLGNQEVFQGYEFSELIVDRHEQLLHFSIQTRMEQAT